MTTPYSPNSPNKTFENLVGITHVNSNVLGDITTIEGNTQFDTNITAGNIINLTLDQTINGNGLIVVNQ